MNPTRRLAQAVYDDDHEKVAELLAQPGIDPNAVNWYGKNCILTTADYRSTQLLLAHPDIDPNGRTNPYFSDGPLESAYENECVDTFLLLLAHPRTDPNIVNQNGRVLLADDTPDEVHRAKMVAALLAHADIDPNRFSWPDDHYPGPPLMLTYSYTTVMALMRHPRIDVNVRLDLHYDGIHCASLAHWCCVRGEIWRLRVLLRDPRIDLTVRNREGLDAWDLCRQRGHRGCLEFLEVHRGASSALDRLDHQIQALAL